MQKQKTAKKNNDRGGQEGEWKKNNRGPPRLFPISESSGFSGPR